MLLSVGAKLGTYEIVAPLGAGGMGEVYKARDTKLGREVAVKVLSATVADDPDTLIRFEREAKLLASLNHPNIAQIYGIEESGATRAIVMELVPGRTLQGPMAVAEALRIAAQIADAVGAAHEKGIIHCDLKPANIMVTPDGVVKVLDLGLADAAQRSAAIPSDPEKSPTLTMGASQAGVLAGTAAYMSPEQTSGKPVDKRTDIWAFGVVLWEILTGKKLFDGETLSHIFAEVLTKEPDFEQVPAQVRRLLGACLEKNPKHRLQDIGDWKLLLDDRAGAASLPAAQSKLPWVLVAVLALLAAWAFAFVYRSSSRRIAQTAIRLSISLPQGQEITSSPAISRDGATIAYAAQQGSDEPHLYLRNLNSFESRVVQGSTGAAQPFFSPDGKWVAFFAQGQLQKAELSGGAPIRLAATVIPFGGTWNTDNSIIFASALRSGLLRVSANGGTPDLLVQPDAAAHDSSYVFPQVLPGGRFLLFTIWGQTSFGAVLALDSHGLVSGAPQLVLPEQTGFAPIFVPSDNSRGHLLVVNKSAGVRAAPFDLSHPTRTNADTAVLTDVYYDESSELRGWLAVSDTGTAVYAPGNPARRSLVWVDRDGKAEPLEKDEDVYAEVSLSPDESKAVVRQGWELWVHDLRHGTRIRITSPDTQSVAPLWSADGKRIIFASHQTGDWDIDSEPADGSKPPEVLLRRPSDQFPLSVLPDGTLLFDELNSKTGAHLWVLSPDQAIAPVTTTPSNQYFGQFSPALPGGRHWIAYSSDESGRNEIYIQAYPSGGRIPVSTGRGILPRWSRDGKELFYLGEDAMMAVAVRPDGSLGAAHKLFDRSNFFLPNGPFQRYDVSADGKRLFMIESDPGSLPRQLNVILHWTDELDRRLQSAQ